MENKEGAALSGTAKPVSGETIYEQFVREKGLRNVAPPSQEEATCTEIINAMVQGIKDLEERTGLVAEAHARLGAIKVLAFTEEMNLVAAMNQAQAAAHQEILQAMMQKGLNDEH